MHENKFENIIQKKKKRFYSSDIVSPGLCQYFNPCINRIPFLMFDYDISYRKNKDDTVGTYRHN